MAHSTSICCNSRCGNNFGRGCSSKSSSNMNSYGSSSSTSSINSGTVVSIVVLLLLLLPLLPLLHYCSCCCWCCYFFWNLAKLNKSTLNNTKRCKAYHFCWLTLWRQTLQEKHWTKARSVVSCHTLAITGPPSQSLILRIARRLKRGRLWS